MSLRAACPPRATTAPATAGHGLVSMLRAGLETAAQRRATWPASGLFGLALLGFIGISGAHLGGPWRADALGSLPGEWLYTGATVVLALAAASTWQRHRPLSALAMMLIAYLLGNLLSGLLHRVADPGTVFADAPALRFIVSRLLYLIGVTAPMALVYVAIYHGRGNFHLGLGDLRARGRIGRNDMPRSWARLLSMFALAVALPLFLLMQAQVGFDPLQSGRLPALALPLLAMALANAIAEEAIFRGFLQGAASATLGLARGLWAVGLLFGLHHWGASFDPIASLPGALAIGAGSVLFGKSVVETRGLGWAIAAHALVNLALFSAYYVKS